MYRMEPTQTAVDWSQLKQDLQGSLYLRALQPEEFHSQTSVFNTAAHSTAAAVVLPKSTSDVVRILAFARSNGLTISVKSGGYAVAGWSVRGQLIISLKLLDSINIRLPTKDGGYEEPIDKSETDQAKSSKRSADLAFTRTRSNGSNSSSSGTSGAETPASSLESAASAVSKPSEATTSGYPKRLKVDQLSLTTIESVATSRRDAPYLTQPTVSNPIVHQLGRQGRVQSLDEPDTVYVRQIAPSDATLQTQYLPGRVSEKPQALPTQAKIEEASLQGPNLPGVAYASAPTPIDRPPHALARFGAGTFTRNLDLFTSQFGYHVPTGAFPVGSAIFSTGGFGFLSRRFGLAMDNVVAATIVMADGRVVNLIDPKSSEFALLEVEEQEEQKTLWWAFRGAGPILGIITEFTARAYPVGRVYAADFVYRFNPATAPSLIKHWRECVKNSSPHFYTTIMLTAGPSPGSHVIVINVSCLEQGGPSSEGLHFVNSISSWPGEAALLKTTELRPFMRQQETFVKVLSADGDMRWAVRSDLLHTLDDKCVEETCKRFLGMPEKTVWIFEAAGNAVAEIDPETTCFPMANRLATFQIAAVHQWRHSHMDRLWAVEAWRWITEVCSPNSTGGPFPSFFDSEEPLERIISTYGGEASFNRLMDIKRKYDPNNVFCHHFIPSDGLQA